MNTDELIELNAKKREREKLLSALDPKMLKSRIDAAESAEKPESQDFAAGVARCLYDARKATLTLKHDPMASHITVVDRLSFAEVALGISAPDQIAA